jgi:hypothetical protein
MIAKQTIHSEYQLDDLRIEIQMGVQVKLPDDDPTVEIGIAMAFEPRLSEELADIFHPKIHSGVLNGIGLSNIPISPPNMFITIFELQTSPPLQEIDMNKYEKNIGYLLLTTTSNILQTLLRGLHNLDTGKEVYD